MVRPAGFEAPEPKSPPADLTEILRASVAALKNDRAPADSTAKPTAKPAAKSAASAKPAARAKPASRAKPAKDTDDDAKAPKTRSRGKAGARKASA